MSPIQPSKRRRLDNASHALSKPFKSPFKTPLKAKPDVETNLSAPSSSPVKHDHTTRLCQPLTSSPPEPYQAPTTTPLRRSLPTSYTCVEVITLQKRHTHLLNQLSASRASLETSNQALKIETSDRDTELAALISKWKVASRAAAEEVFAGARDKVNKMGGVGAMRERENQKETAWGWDEGPRKDSEEDKAGHEEDGDGFRIGEDEGEEQDEREEGAEKVEISGDDDEGYTIDMMLKTLNIELDLIGYDKGLQKWVD